ncbi:RlpA-like double-psi beta-barrel domain-containing protein [Sporobolomyces salmoneus]|uniref:RlpA-like double-psi beta-barrel domain-containing protein n=1 Tax=Sporobolomyces salmoneus TaxID=183962 RepID=UPI00317087BB
MIVPSASFVALSLLTLTSALPFSPSSSQNAELDISTGSGWPHPSRLSSSLKQQDPSARKRGLELDLGGEGGIVVLETNAVDDGSLADDSSFREGDDSNNNNDQEETFDASDNDAGKVVRNPKVVPNPKSPKFSPSSDTAAAASTMSSPASSPTGKTFTGQATYFYQNGVAGACGNVNPDSAYIVALDYRLYGDMGKKSKYCGKSLTITNTDNGKSVVATVADACPTCSTQKSLDLSTAAFGAIGDYDTGILPIKWYWN